jgi:hypothetical protein
MKNHTVSNLIDRCHWTSQGTLSDASFSEHPIHQLKRRFIGGLLLEQAQQCPGNCASNRFELGAADLPEDHLSALLWR